MIWIIFNFVICGFRFDWMDGHMSLELDLIVYLRTRPEIAYERMMQRGRSEETGNAGPPLDYLKILHKAHEDWLMKQKYGELKPKIIVLDANQDLNHMRNHYEPRRVSRPDSGYKSRWFRCLCKTIFSHAQPIR